MDTTIILWFICTVQALCLAFAVSKITKTNERIEMVRKADKLEDYTEAIEKVEEIDRDIPISSLSIGDIKDKVLKAYKKKKIEEEREKGLFEWVDEGGNPIPKDYL